MSRNLLAEPPVTHDTDPETERDASRAINLRHVKHWMGLT
jgi:hypothetical protein